VLCVINASHDDDVEASTKFAQKDCCDGVSCIAIRKNAYNIIFY